MNRVLLAGVMAMAGLLGGTPGESADAMVTPLALDLSGKGLAFTDVRASTTRFDIDGDGRIERVAWVFPRGADTTAFLVLDRDGNGLVNNGSELFGDQHGARHGYAELAKFDDNGDRVMDAQDAIFPKLLLWQDRDGNGRSDPSEMLTLATARVTSIDLHYSVSKDRDVHGNGLYQQGTFERVDGTKGRAADVWLRLDRREDVGAML